MSNASLLEGEFPPWFFQGSIYLNLFSQTTQNLIGKYVPEILIFLPAKATTNQHYSNRIGPSKHLRSEVRGSTGPSIFLPRKPPHFSGGMTRLAWMSILGCPRKLGSMVSKWVISYNPNIYPIYISQVK